MTTRSSALYATTVTFDEQSNITSTTDEIHQRDLGAGAFHLYDNAYASDDLGRLVSAETGELSGLTITSGKETRYEEWGLSPTGNWTTDKLDLNGDGDFADAKMNAARATRLTWRTSTTNAMASPRLQ